MENKMIETYNKNVNSDKKEFKELDNSIKVSPYLLEIIRKIEKLDSDDNLDKLSETEKMYYALKIIYEIDKLRKAQIGAIVDDALLYSDTIRYLKSIVKKLSREFKTSSIFGEVTDKPELERHPFVKSLESSKLLGKSYEDATKILCGGFSVNPLAFSHFAEENELAYPIIEKTSPEFAEGSAAAKRDSTSASIAKAYKWAERDVTGKPGSVDNFIAGYLQAYRATNEEVDKERKKMIIKRFGTQDDVDDLLAKKLEMMARNKEI